MSGKGEEMVRLVMFFFFKQKTAYEMLRSLVGSEMCIRDRSASQKWWLTELKKQGYMTSVAKGFDEAIKTLKEYLK